MKKSTLAFGTKINWTFAALAAVLALTVAFGFYTTGSLEDSLAKVTGRTVRKIQLAGTLNSARCNMAVGTRSTILFAFAKDPAQITSSRQLFQENSESFRKSLAEITPLLTTEEGKQLAANM